jgi:hypothetical protein
MTPVTSQNISRADRVYVLGSVLTFGGDRLWGRALEHLNDEEFTGTCPACGCNLYFTIGESGFGFSTVNDFNADAKTRREPIRPRHVQTLSRIGKWLFDIASGAGDHELASRICYLFGDSVCTSCNAPISVPEATERFEGAVR